MVATRIFTRSISGTRIDRSPTTDSEAEVWTDRARSSFSPRRHEMRRFFLVVSMGPLPRPLRVCAGAATCECIDPATLTLPSNWVEGTLPAPVARKSPGDYAAITAVDEQVGRLLKALDDSGRSDDTIVVVTSDHGDMLGSHGQRLWPQAVGRNRDPAFRASFATPRGRQAGPGVRRDPEPCRPVPLTLLSLCGLPVPDRMQGSDLSPVLIGTSERGPDSAFFQIFVPFAGDGTPRPWARGPDRSRYMPMRRNDQGPWLLYNLRDDPDERDNLASDRAPSPLQTDMEARLADWMKRTGDSWANNSLEPVEDKGRLYRFEAFITIRDYLDWAKLVHPELAPKD